MKRTSLLLSTICLAFGLNAQVVNVGSGSYTTQHPGVDKEGRNHVPSGTPFLSGAAADRPAPTNDWWSTLIKNGSADNLFTYPFTLKTVNEGLIVTYIPQGVIGDLYSFTVGLPSLNAANTTISDFSDWAITMNWTSGENQLEATAGIAMPFIYFNKKSSENFQVKIAAGTPQVIDEILIIKDAKNGADFVFYAPKGSTWTNAGTVYSSSLNGKDYCSLAFLPDEGNIENTAKALQQYAYVYPTNTTAEYTYDEATSTVRTEFRVETEVKEGTATAPLIGLLPHHWGNISADSPELSGHSLNSIRGEIKLLAQNNFAVEHKYYGILPTLPAMKEQSLTYNDAELQKLIDVVINDTGLQDWTDSYNDGQILNRLIQTARIAELVGSTEKHATLLALIENRIQNWLSYKNGEIAFLFYYHEPWDAMLGYPAGHGQDGNLNDHHFHWGYLIHAAAYMEQCKPGWAEDWGDMINILIRDAASYDRNDTMFPYLRNFSPYAGHCWANGFASFPQGNDQESTSESMQFNSSLIHWGTITNNKEILDLGIYLYTTEQAAVEEYWFDMHERTFGPGQQYSVVSRIWGNNLDNQTFWTQDLAASYGIELYPIHGGSFYLSHNSDYAEKLWAEIKKNTGITRNEANKELWHDTMWKYAAFTNPDEALEMHDSYPDREMKFGMSAAQTYYWLHAMKALGRFSVDVTADYPIAAAFNRSGRMTYVAHNYGSTPLTVTYTDGFKMEVPARQMKYEQVGELKPEVKITSHKNNTKIMLGETVTITATAADFTSSAITKVDFYVDGEFISSDNSAPYSATWTAVDGNHILQAKATNANDVEGESAEISVIVTADTSCSETSNEASQGAFSTGYKTSFETIGNEVHISFQMLDTDKVGVVAYLWQENPFSEQMMNGGADNTFTTVLKGLENGKQLRIAAKFAYAGGMSVTKYFDYTVGNNCGSSTNVEELESGSVLWHVQGGALHLRSENSAMVKVYTITGQLVYTNNIEQHTAIPLDGGIYLVQVGTLRIKVYVP